MTGDFNGDGKTDVVTIGAEFGPTVALYPGNGDGTLGPPLLSNGGLAGPGEFYYPGKEDNHNSHTGSVLDTRMSEVIPNALREVEQLAHEPLHPVPD